MNANKFEVGQPLNTDDSMNDMPTFVERVRENVPEALEYLEQHPECKRQWQQKHKLYKDPRCCVWGNFLRRFSLDELPQLVNVIRGDMALVGPRPIIQEEVHHYGDRAELLFSVKPGMTGLWQVSGRNLTTYRRRVAMDAYYAKHKCASLDAWILYRTIWAVLGGRGAF